MKVLVACESSGVVRQAFRDRGHDAWSCDLLPAEDGSGFHIQFDVRDVIVPYRWDLLIAHPPCTYLSSSGMHWTTRGLRDPQLTEDALAFVRRLMDAPIPRVAIENPVGVISTRIRKPDQIVKPYEFGDDASKRTCLWLSGLPPLRIDPGQFVRGRLVCTGCGMVVHPRNPVAWQMMLAGGCPRGCVAPIRPRWDNQTDSGQNRLGPSPDRWKERSRTYPGIARAMAEQWG